jgi:hypothetical protein
MLYVPVHCIVENTCVDYMKFVFDLYSQLLNATVPFCLLVVTYAVVQLFLPVTEQFL